MGARKYGISLQVSAANERNVELNTRKEISYLQATTYYFVYHINTITLYWRDKSTLLINENKRIAKRWIKIVKCVGAKAQDENMRCNITTTNNRRNFPYTKSSDSDLVLTDRRNPSGTRLRSACGKSFSCRFSFSAARNAISKATEKVTFGFSFRIFVFSPSRKVWTSLSVSNTDFQCFSNYNPKKFRQTTLDWV